jgi:hypothetical protein
MAWGLAAILVPARRVAEPAFEPGQHGGQDSRIQRRRGIVVEVGGGTWPDSDGSRELVAAGSGTRLRPEATLIFHDGRTGVLEFSRSTSSARVTKKGIRTS